MNKNSTIYLVTVFNDNEVVESVAFSSKQKASDHIIIKYPAYKAYAVDHSEDIEFWMKSDSEGLLLEQVRLIQ